MKGFVLNSKDNVSWRDDLPITKVGPLDALIRPTVISPCTTDIHLIHAPMMPSAIGKAMGHEAVGIVEKVGSEVAFFKPGDLVAVSAIQPDWRTIEAQENMGKLNDKCHYYTTDPEKGGCFAEFYHVFDADMNLAPIPEGVTTEQAIALVDMGATGFTAVDSANIKFGDTVVIYGIGPVGLMCVQGAILKGAARVIGVGSRQVCFDVARQFGASDLVDYKKGDVCDQVFKLTNGKPVDSVIITGGSTASYGTALKMIKVGGTVVNLSGFFDEDTVVLPNAAWMFGIEDKTIKTCKIQGGRAYLERLLKLTQYKRLQPELIITHRFHGLEKIEDAVSLMSSRDQSVIKPAVFID
ncbi:zinc-binding dehydrogenase [Lachnospiraceae bacterium ZAX-1]